MSLIRILNNIDVDFAELSNVRVENISGSLPSAGNAGRLIYLSSNGSLYYDNGTQWVRVTEDLIIDIAGTAPIQVSVNNKVATVSILSNAITNVGTGAGVFKGMSGSQFQLKSLKANSTKISVSGATDEVNFDVNEANLTLNNIGGTLGVTKGGTGLTSCSQGDLFYGSDSNVIAKLAKNTTATRYLSNTGTNNNPQWNTVNLANGVSGTLAIANGGTGATTAAGARSNLGAVGKYVTNVGNGTDVQFTITHNLNTQDIIVQVYENSTKELVVCDVQFIDNNNAKVIFGTAPSSNQFKVVVMG